MTTEAMSRERIEKVLGAAVVAPWARLLASWGLQGVYVLHERPIEVSTTRDGAARPRDWRPLMESVGYGVAKQMLRSRSILRELRQKPEEAASFRFAPTGGVTEVRLILTDGTYGRGRAVCSDKDPFCYAVGRKLALVRAMEVVVGVERARREGARLPRDGALAMMPKDEEVKGVVSRLAEEGLEREKRLRARQAHQDSMEDIGAAAEDRRREERFADLPPVKAAIARRLQQPSVAEALLDHLNPYLIRSPPPTPTIYDTICSMVEASE